MAGSLASINILFRVDLKQLSTDLQNSVREIKKSGEALQNIGSNLSLYLTAPVLAAGAASLKTASDFEESQNKVEVAFKDSTAVVAAFAKTTLTSFGIAEGSALDMAALFGDMATSMGLDTKEAAKLSTSLVGLAGDLASFKNIGIEQATTALNGVFTGETESLKMLGIVMTEANLAQFALTQGITKSLKSMTQAEKVQLRYAYVMKQTTNAQGDFLRTGGGAANQWRVFMEGLKELAAQIGQVVLPAFASLMKRVNEIVAVVKSMNPELRTTIVVIAGVAASLGPLIYSLGTAAKAYANLASTAYKAAGALAANPLTVAAVALGALATWAVVADTRLTSLTDSTREFNRVMQSGADSIARESVELNKNLEIARNSIYPRKQREEAIKAINAISPEYLGNLSLENIHTLEAINATDKYVAALKQKARVMAAQEKLIEVEKKLLDLQLANLDAVKPSVWQNFSNLLQAGGNNMVYAALSAQTLGENLYTETNELNKLKNSISGFLVENEKMVASQTDVSAATNLLNESLAGSGLVLRDSLNNLIAVNKNFSSSQEKVNKVLNDGSKVGTIKYYQGLIDDLQKLQNESTTTSVRFAELQSQIDKYQEKIKNIKGERTPVASVVPALQAPSLTISDDKKRIDFYGAEITRFKELQKAYLEGSATFLRIQSIIDGLDFTIKLNVDPASVIKTGELFKRVVTDFEIQKMRLQTMTADFEEATKSILNNISQNFLEGFGEVLGSIASGANGMQSIFSLLISTLADVAIQIGKAAIGIGLAMEGIKASFKFPGTAIAAGVALIAIGNIMKNQLKNIQGFANGGIVGGSSYSGDKLFARVNSGEMILNQRQQSNLSNMINPAMTGSDLVVQLMGGFEIEGSKLKLVLKRTDDEDKRKK